MSIALDLSTVGSIATYSALVDEIRDQMDDENYSQDAINRALRKVEDQLNRALRVPDMERTAVLNVVDGAATLPDDFLDMRALRPAGLPVDLAQMTPSALDWAYRGGSRGGRGYAIEGLSLRLLPIASATLDMLYFARIPALTEDVQSNWLLDKHADCYVAGAMYHLARRERDGDGAGQAGTEFLGIIDAIQVAGQSARWGAGVIVPQGMSQVRGVRA